MPEPRKWWVLGSVACGTFMATLDSSIVNIALPTLTKALSAPLNESRWIIILYLLCITCLLLPIGKLSDLFGRKKLFLAGYALFTISSVLCGVSTSLTMLLISRGLQGVGAAMLMANGPAIITRAFPSHELGAALGTMGMVVSCGLVAGPSLGGILITHFGWGSIFLVNLPIGILGIVLAQQFVTDDLAPEESAPFDWLGTFLQMGVLITILSVFSPVDLKQEEIWTASTSKLGLSALAAFLLLTFIQHERNSDGALLDLNLFRVRNYWSANLASFFTFVAFASVTVLMPFFLEEVKLFSTDHAGYFMTAIPLTIFVIAPISGILSDRFGSRGLSSIGAVISMLCLLILSGALGGGLGSGMSSSAILAYLCMMGLSIGLFQSPNNSAIMGSVPKDKLGSASATLAVVRTLGMAMGTGLATALFTLKKSATGEWLEGMKLAFRVASFFAFGAFLASLAKTSKQKKEIGT